MSLRGSAWLSRVRFFLITLLLALVLVLGKTSQLEVSTRYFIPLMILWYTLAIVYTILLRWMPVASWHGRRSVGLRSAHGHGPDLPDRDAGQLFYLALSAGHHRRQHSVFARSHVHRGGLQLHSARRPGGADLLQRPAAHADCRAQQPPVANLDLQQSVLFHGRGVLSSLLAQSLRRQSAELEVKRGELQDLQAFNEDIIHSMRGGLLTTDLDGRILLLNRTGEEITGSRFHSVKGTLLQDIWPSFWLPGDITADGKLPQRREVDFLTPDGQQRFIGISVSPLRTGERRTTGYVFNFQDLTDLKRLEQEVATKERMAALGRLSAAIAHEIRQPLTAMAGAVKELGRLVPLEEDEQHLVGIVSRESERLNKIITEFLNYSREKTYDFSEEDVSSILG